MTKVVGHDFWGVCMDTVTVATSYLMCYGCGVCKIVCPVGAVAYRIKQDDFRYALINHAKCINCGRCRGVCPSRGWRNNHLMHDKSLEETSKGLGPYHHLYFCHANDNALRKSGTSGGMVTAVLKYLLESRIIDGAVIPFYGGILNAKFRIATTIQQIIQQQKSKYFCIPFDVPIDEMLQYEKLAIVGLPCHLESLTNVCKFSPELGKMLYMKIGLFCGHVQKKIFYHHLLKTRNMKLKNIESLNFRPGEWWNLAYFNVQSNQGTQTWQFRGDEYVTALISSRLFSREACVYCPDFTARMADLSFGDGWHIKLKDEKEGYNYGIVRSDRAVKLFNEMKQKGVIKLESSSPEEYATSNLYGNLLYKQHRIRARLSYLRKKDWNVLKNIDEPHNWLDYFRFSIYFKVKTVAELLERANLLSFFPGIVLKIAKFERYFLREENIFKVFKPLIRKINQSKKNFGKVNRSRLNYLNKKLNIFKKLFSRRQKK